MPLEPQEIAPGITVDSRVSSGKPVVKGTRIAVDVVLHQLAAGVGFEEMEKEYGLSRKNILDVLRYAADIVSSETAQAR